MAINRECLNSDICVYKCNKCVYMFTEAHIRKKRDLKHVYLLMGKWKCNREQN